MTQPIIPDSSQNVKSNHPAPITPKEVVNKTVSNKANTVPIKEAEGAEETQSAKEASSRMANILEQLKKNSPMVRTEAIKRGEELLKRGEGYPTPEDLDRLAFKIVKG